MPGFDPGSATPEYDSSITPEQYFGAVKGMYPNAVFTSGYRTPQHNAAVGGAPNSMHTTNQAVDFQVPGVSSNQVFSRLLQSGLPETEDLNEGNHLHVGWRPKGGQVPPFDPTSAVPMSGGGGFDPSSASPEQAPAPQQPRAAGATGFGQVGQMFDDLTNPNHPNHDPNALEQGVIGATYSKPIQYIQGAYKSEISNGSFIEPVRAGMEVLGIGRQAGESDASLHQRYNDAITASRQQAQQQMQSNQVGSYGPGSSLSDKAARFGQQLTGIGAGLAANPEYFLLPGMAAGDSMAARIATASLGNAAIGSASDTAAQVMDMAEGQKKSYDIEQNLVSTLMGGLIGAGLHGAVEVAPFVKGLFGNRGMDTTPQADPRMTTSPMTGDTVRLNYEDGATYRHLLKTGSVDDIKGFFQGRNGPQPSWTDVNDWVEHRDNPPTTNGQAAPDQSRQPDFDYEREYNRQAVEDHVNQQMAGWKNAPDVEVVHGPEDIANPKIRQEVMAADPDGKALGLFGSDGKVRMFSGRITDPEAANAVLFHEGLGHFGLAQQFGDRLNQVLQTMYDRNIGKFKPEVDAYLKANPGASTPLAAEEVLAKKSQGGQMKPTWRSAVGSAVKQFGRKMGLNLAYSDGEIDHVLAMSHDAVVNGTDVRSNGFKGATQDPNKFMGKWIRRANDNQRRGWDNLSQAEKYRRVTSTNRNNIEYYNEEDTSKNPGRDTGPIPTDEPANKFMFVGEKSQGFNHNGDTTFLGKDNRYREEISDRRARLYDSPGDTLGSTLQHPELFDRYPELRDIPVRHSSPDGFEGAYSSDEHGKLIEYDRNAPSPISTVLHETQHAIQDIEGYPDFERAKATGGTHANTYEQYINHPSEIEARSVEDRRGFTDQQRTEIAPPKFMTRDALGREQEDPANLDLVDRLKQDPRFWSDPEYRANVAELARTRFPPDAPVNKFITRAQLGQIANKSYDPDDIEGIAKHLESNYTPNEVSWKDTRAAALKAGISTNKIKGLSEGNPGDLAQRVAQIGAAADYAAMKVGDILKRFGTPDWKPDDHLNLAQAIAERQYLVERFKGETNEIGRALNTVKVFKSYTNGNIADVLQRLQEEGASGLAALADPTNPSGLKFAKDLKDMLENGNPDGAQTKMSQVNKPYWEQYANTAHMNMMLSALSTHVKAPVDMATGIARNVIEKAIAMPIGKVRQAFEAMTGQTVQPSIGAAELANHLFGIMKAVSDGEVYRQAWNAVRTGQSSYVVNGKATRTNFANTFGAQSNPRLGDSSPLGKVVGLGNKPTDLISAQDTFFRSVEINAQLLSLGAREARADLGPKASITDVMTLGHSKAMNPTPSMLKEAYDTTNKTLLLNDNPLNSVVNKLRTYRPGMNPAQRFGAFVANTLMPFIRVESNSLINRVILRSPLGLLNYFNAASDLRAGGAKADIAMSKIVYGTVLLGMMWTAADKTKDYLTGDGPGNVDQYKQKIASGWRPDAVHENGQYTTGGNQLGMSINPFDMHNKTAQMVASARQAYDAGMNQGSVGIAIKLALGSIGSNLTRQSWASDIDPTLSALTGQGEDAQSKLTGVAMRQAQSWVPNIFHQTANISDGVQRDTTSPGSISGAVGNSMADAVPGLRQNLPIKYSVYGEPLQQGASWSGEHVPILSLSGNHTTQTNDPTEMELDRLNSLGDHAVVTPVERSVTLDDGTKRALDPHEFEEYQRVAGRYIVENVKQEMSTPEWQAMSDVEKVDEVKSIESDQKANAREELFNQ